MAQPSHTLRIEIALLVLLSFLWGGSFTLIEIAITTIPPASVVLGRLVIGAAALFAAVLWMGIKIPTSPGQWGALIVQGVLQSALPFTLISWGQQHIDSGLAGLLTTTPPLFVFLIGLATPAGRHRGLSKGAGVIVGFSGVLAIMGPAAFSGSGSNLIGQLAVCGASLSYAAAALYAKRFSGQPPLLTAACSMAMAALTMLPVAWICDAPLGPMPSAQSIAAVLAMGLLSTAAAMAIYFRLVQTLGPLGVTTGSYLRAGFSIVLGTALLGEAVSPTLFVGLALIVLGVALTTGQLRLPVRVPGGGN
ncbi:MAG: EamA family transporter [Thalassobaculaceae bacterium]|nr:EamA family transporter [Thalassobaculaceae bacterium]